MLVVGLLQELEAMQLIMVTQGMPNYVNAASGWDMWINLATTYPNGGWVYFKINNDSYMQLSGSDNKVNIYKDTPISGNIDVGKDDVMLCTTQQYNNTFKFIIVTKGLLDMDEFVNGEILSLSSM